MSVKDDFVRGCVRELFRKGITKKSLEHYLSSCWYTGALTAMAAPDMAFEALPELVRREFATQFIETLIKDYLDELGEKATRKAMREVATEIVESDAIRPVAKLSAEDDWLVGRRSAN